MKVKFPMEMITMIISDTWIAYIIFNALKIYAF